MQQTMVLIKPDGFHRALVGRIISRFEEKGLLLVGAKLVQLDEETLNKHYKHLLNKPFFEEIKQFMRSGPVMSMVWEGVDSVQTVRHLCGITNAREAEPGTIRGDWGMSVMCNLVHASDSLENAEKEISLFFKIDELIQYERVDAPFLYSERENQT